jgi:hypothetical protein
MGQKRNATGIAFENLLPEGFVRVAKSPKMVWSGLGKNNFQKIISCEFDVNKFTLNWDKSKFEKSKQLFP